MINLPDIDKPAFFSFKAGFKTLDGIYKYTNLTTFRKAIDDKISFVNDLYIPAGKTQDDYEVDYNKYINDNIITLEKIDNDKNIIHVPVSLLDKIPNQHILPCHDLHLSIELGKFRDPDKLTYMIEQLTDIAASVTGSEKSVNIFSSSVKWMTVSEYKILEEERTLRISKLTLFSEIINSQSIEIKNLQTIVSKMETTLKNLAV